MRLAAGHRLGPYEIVSPLGAGGMGEIYRARDPRLGREVAVKVVASELANDADRLARFEQEARAASALQHPGILSVFDVGEQDGTTFLVTELLEGETLRDRLAQGALSLRKVLDFGAQLAAALAAAHERGIVHRDLKPENIFLTRDGRAKILDFGLARLQPATASNSQLAAAPTALAGTTPGLVVGTVGYMAPEQVRGQSVDARADLFSLGAVLYEMLTARRAFQRDSNADTLAAILREEPEDLGAVPGVPPSLERLVAHLLEKNPADRFASARDLAFALEALGASRAGSSAIAAPVAPPRAALGGWGLVAAAVVAVALALGLAFFAGQRSVSVPASSAARSPHGFSRLTDERGAEFFPSLAPDGSAIVYCVPRPGADFNIWLQRVGGHNPTNLTADCELGDSTPAFSPDGTRIAFTSVCHGGGLFVMGATGENKRRLSSRGANPSWFPDGSAIVFSTGRFTIPSGRGSYGELWRVDTSSGQETRLFEGDAVQPSVSPHGKRIAFWALPRNGSQRDIWTIPASGLRDGESPVPVTQDAAIDWNPLWAPDGRHLYFLSDRGGSWNLWRVGIEEESGKAVGAPEPWTLPATQVLHASLSGDGRRIAYLASYASYWIERYPFDPAAGRVLGTAERVWETTRRIEPLSASPDGRFLVGNSWEPVEDIGLFATDGSEMRQLTDDPARDRNPTFSPDGRRIAFQSDRSGAWELWLMAADGGGLTQLTHTTGAQPSYPNWLPDRRLLFLTAAGEIGVVEIEPPRVGETEILLTPPAGKEFDSITYSAETSRYYALASDSGGAVPPALVTWRAGDHTVETLVENSPGAVLAFGRYVLSVRSGQLGVFDPQSREYRLLPEVTRPGGRDPRVAQIVFSPDFRSLYVQRFADQGDLFLAALE